MVTSRWVVLALALVVCAIVAASYVAVRAYRGEAAAFHGQQHPVPSDEAAAALPNLEAITIETRGGPSIRGWYARGTLDAAVVLSHGTAADRRSVLPEATALARRGLSVLLFDYPGHGESEGTPEWSSRERRALVAALDFLTTRAELADARIGVLGVSMGGVVAAQVAAEDARIAALALVSTPPDLRTLIAYEYRSWGALAAQPALWALTRNGMKLDETNVAPLLRRVAPRPVLLVQGTHDPLIAVEHARELAMASAGHGELLLLDAGHADFSRTASDAYAASITSFFVKHLDLE